MLIITSVRGLSSSDLESEVFWTLFLTRVGSTILVRKEILEYLVKTSDGDQLVQDLYGHFRYFELTWLIDTFISFDKLSQMVWDLKVKTLQFTKKNVWKKLPIKNGKIVRIGPSAHQTNKN